MDKKKPRNAVTHLSSDEEEENGNSLQPGPSRQHCSRPSTSAGASKHDTLGLSGESRALKRSKKNSSSKADRDLYWSLLSQPRKECSVKLMSTLALKSTCARLASSNSQPNTSMGSMAGVSIIAPLPKGQFKSLPRSFDLGTFDKKYDLCKELLSKSRKRTHTDCSRHNRTTSKVRLLQGGTSANSSGLLEPNPALPSVVVVPDTHDVAMEERPVVPSEPVAHASNTDGPTNTSADFMHIWRRRIIPDPLSSSEEDVNIGEDVEDSPLPSTGAIITTQNITDLPSENERTLTPDDPDKILHDETDHNKAPVIGFTGPKLATTPLNEELEELNNCLLTLLECPVCLEWMEPPIGQCRRGHLVCRRCCPRLRACPVCRSSFTSVRNRAMEQVAEKLRYPCRYSCGEKMQIRKRARHEGNCLNRSYRCPIVLCADVAALPYDLMLKHHQEKHADILVSGASHKYDVKLCVHQHKAMMIQAHGKLFHVNLKVDMSTWSIHIYATFIGPKSKASKYIYQVSIDGKHNSRKMFYSRVCHSDLESQTLNYTRKDSFFLPIDQALNFLRMKTKNVDTNTTLPLNIEILENVDFYMRGEESSDEA